MINIPRRHLRLLWWFVKTRWKTITVSIVSVFALFRGIKLLIKLYKNHRAKRPDAPLPLPQKIYSHTIVTLSEFRGPYLGKEYVPKHGDGMENHLAPIGDMQVQKVVAGDRQSYVIMKSGTVYSFGEDYENELGLNLTSMRMNQTSQICEIYEPQEIPRVTGVIDLSSHHRKVIALTNRNTIYQWGEGNLPMEYHYLFESAITHIFQRDKSFALSEGGEVYEWDTEEPIVSMQDVKHASFSDNHRIVVFSKYG